jgi:hypothetical protein
MTGLPQYPLIARNKPPTALGASSFRTIDCQSRSSNYPVKGDMLAIANFPLLFQNFCHFFFKIIAPYND